MLSTDPSKVNVIIYLAKKLRNEVTESELTDPVILRLILILNYVVIVLFKVAKLLYFFFSVINS